MTEFKMQLVSREDLSPICPHCNQQLHEVYTKAKGPGFIAAKNMVYFCSHCHKVLGFGQSRMA